MADKFIVFDSFDHAMLTDAGSQIFEAVAAGFVPNYGALAQKNEATGGSVKTRRALQSKPKEHVIFSLLHRGNTPITADCWQGMASLFAPQPFVIPSPILRMSWESGQGPMASLMPFLSFGGGVLDQDSDRSVEIGLASKLRVDGAMELISSISVGEQAMGFGLDDQRVLIGIAKAEMGLNATLNDANRFFLARSKADIPTERPQTLTLAFPGHGRKVG